jgi:simple sugar transport system permease protein
VDEALIGGLLASTLRLSTPLILCALAAVISERSGVIDLGLEGKMLLSAFAAGAAGALTGSLPLALLAALVVGIALSLVHAYVCVSHRGDQVVLGIAWFKQGGQTPPLSDAVRLSPWFADAAKALGPLLGGGLLSGELLGGGLLGHTGLVYAALALVPVVWWGLYRSRAGLRLRACGENPAMVDAAGLSVKGLRYGALVLNGALCSLAGSYLVLAQNANFVPNMTAGRGYMALAAMIFGKWHPVGALWACLLFGFLDAVAIRLQGAALPGSLGGGAVPVQAIQALPYVMTVVLLAGFIGRARAPAALGKPFVTTR